MSTVIKVENLSKQYRLGQVGTGTISHDVNRWWHKIRGKEDPYLKIGESNDRTVKGDSDYVWALKDINFEVKQGEVLGIIGRNGAGKSTLLKILSRTTAPTMGSVKIKGRVASLLEVGTGFHPELSGRDNIFLNGAILGMTRREIQSKFDEIVDFAGVERYIDTPVKRYSSGMYVRLAFAVAAHLEPEILIVDEVLAVGDAEFQKKCIGKMKDVSVNQGRTVLFVSHNLQIIQKICSSCLFMKHGTIFSSGDVHEIINKYLQNEDINSLKYFATKDTINGISAQIGFVNAISFEGLQNKELKVLKVGSYFQIRVNFELRKKLDSFIIGVGISTNTDIPVHTSWSKPEKIENGIFEAIFEYDNLLFASGLYKLALGMSNHEVSFHFLEEAILFEVSEVKDQIITNDKRIIKTSGVGVVINPVNVKINKLS